VSESFRQKLGLSESGNRYDVVNDEGFTGRYQFGKPRLQDYMKATGQEFTMQEFLQDPVLQENVQDWHERDILSYAAREGILDRQGQTVAGVPINAGSIIGMAHLGGRDGMKRFIESGGEYNPADSNNTSLADYGLRFSGSYYEEPEMTEAAARRAYGLGDTNLQPSEVLQGMQTGQVRPEEAAAYFSEGFSPQPQEEASFLDKLGGAAGALKKSGLMDAPEQPDFDSLSMRINPGRQNTGSRALQRMGIASLA